MSNLGVAYRSAGQLERAIAMLEQALKAERSKMGEDHPYTRSAEGQLAQTYEKALRYQDAERLYQSGHRNRRPEKTAQRSLLFGHHLAAFGRCLIAEQKHAEAATRLRECLDIKEQTQLDDWSTANARSLLGAAFAGQKAFAEAEPLLLNAQKVLFDRRNKIHLDRDTTCATLWLVWSGSMKTGASPPQAQDVEEAASSCPSDRST